MSFRRDGRHKSPSFPRKRESTPRASEGTGSRDWIPAFAGMTGVSKRTPAQVAMAAVPDWRGKLAATSNSANGDTHIPGRRTHGRKRNPARTTIRSLLPKDKGKGTGKGKRKGNNSWVVE